MMVKKEVSGTTQVPAALGGELVRGVPATEGQLSWEKSTTETQRLAKLALLMMSRSNDLKDAIFFAWAQSKLGLSTNSINRMRTY